MARVKFNIECEMDDSQVGTFLGLLDYMEYCGKIGHTSNLMLYIDGDGGFRPEFKCPYQVAYVQPKERVKKFLTYSDRKNYDLYLEHSVHLE